MKNRLSKLCCFLLIGLSITLVPYSIMAQESTLQISNLRAPIPVPTTQGLLFLYELQMINTSDKTLRVGLIEITDEAGTLLTTYSGKKLQDNSFIYQGTQRLDGKEIELTKGMGAFVYVWIAQAKAIKTLQHKIWIEERFVDKGEARAWPLMYRLNVSEEKPVTLGHPLHGANWVASAAPSPNSYHRRTILPFDGAFYLAQRYAIDWMQVCGNGTGVQGDVRKNIQWNSFGEEIHAVSNAIVSKIHEGVAENTPPHLPTPQLKLADISGNYVMLKIQQNDKEYYVLNAHMQPGSIRVKEGDFVKEGQVIGLLGNTGNSSAPHLHIHVCDANDPLKSEGVPFVFKEVDLAGNIEEIDVDYGIWHFFNTQSVKTVKYLMPIDNQVFNFTDRLPRRCDH